MMGSAEVSDRGMVLVAVPLPEQFTQTLNRLDSSRRWYIDVAAQLKQVRRTYIGILLLVTLLVLFAATWLALFVSKLVTRPVAALAEATQEISRGRLDHRVAVPAADELGELVVSFNNMAGQLEASRQQLEASSRSLERANQQLDERRREIETILESIPTGVLSIGSSGIITHANGAFVRMFGASHKLVVGGTLHDVFDAEVISDIAHLLRKASRMGATTSQLEVPLNGQHSKLDAAVTVASLQHDGKALGFVIVFEDLSDVVKAQRQAAWREVARRVAHEIKNPLTPIALSAQRIKRHLERGTPDAQSLGVLQSCADTIASSVETVRTLVNEFSTLARFPTAQPQPASVNAIVKDALAMFADRLNGITVQTFLAADVPRAMADYESLKRAVANLIDNAAEAMRDALVKEIQISTALMSGREAVEIVVADSGHGINGDVKEKLFLPYFSTKDRGTGLGLAIVSRIVEDHHGSIRVEENSPVGARFIIELPVAPEAVSQSAAHA
jgi:PAS domain S-box-containing protein